MHSVRPEKLVRMLSPLEHKFELNFCEPTYWLLIICSDVVTMATILLSHHVNMCVTINISIIMPCFKGTHHYKGTEVHSSGIDY